MTIYINNVLINYIRLVYMPELIIISLDYTYYMNNIKTFQNINNFQFESNYYHVVSYYSQLELLNTDNQKVINLHLNIKSNGM